MLGVEAVDNMLFGTAELTLHHPNIVNGRKNSEPRYQPPPGHARQQPQQLQPQQLQPQPQQPRQCGGPKGSE
jgi:hypothetical protein